MESLNTVERKQLRSLLFKHQDGLAICNTIAVLEKHQLFDFLESKSVVLLEDLIEAFPALNAAYLNVALRSLNFYRSN